MIADLKPYAEYKASGLPWIGDGPQHWQERRLDTLFTLRRESPQPGDQRITGYLDGRVTLRSNVAGQKIKGVVKEAGWQRVYPGDFAISGMNAHLGGMGVSDSLGKCSPIYLVLIPKPDTNAHYVSHAVRHTAHMGALKALVSTIRFNSADFKREDLKSIRLMLPPPDEQAAIVRFLDYANRRLERAIRAKRKVIALLNEQKQAIIHRAVTRGLDPNAPLKPSGLHWLGEIPAHWEVRQLGRFITLQRGFDITKDQQAAGSIPVVSSGGVSSYHNKSTSQGPGVIVGRKGSVGTVHFIEEPYWAHDTTLWVKDFGGNHPKFVYYVLSLLDLKRFDTGSANPTLNRNIVHPEIVAFPPPDEQVLISAYLDNALTKMKQAIIRTEREIALLREYRTRLIADVVTGKLDVRGVAATLPDETDEPAMADGAEAEDEAPCDDEEASE
ncbi:MAG: restriction endonuclease subunit S [Blastocatellales bacterium]